MSEICVLGTGMAGYGAAHKLREAGVRGILFDQKPHYGGTRRRSATREIHV